MDSSSQDNSQFGQNHFFRQDSVLPFPVVEISQNNINYLNRFEEEKESFRPVSPVPYHNHDSLMNYGHLQVYRQIKRHSCQHVAPIEPAHVEQIDSDAEYLSSLESVPDEHEQNFECEDHINHYKYTSCIKNCRLYLKGVTWNRDSHGLFDYEQRHLSQVQLSTEVPKKLVRDHCKLELFDSEDDYRQKLGDQGQLLLNIEKKNNKYFLKVPQVPKSDDLVPQFNNDSELIEQPNIPPKDVIERVYLVVRSLKRNTEKKVRYRTSLQDYELKKNDIIKLGRVKFRVRDILRREEKLEKDRKELRKRIRKELNKVSGKKEDLPKKDEEKLKQLHGFMELFSSSNVNYLEGEENSLEIQAILEQKKEAMNGLNNEEDKVGEMIQSKRKQPKDNEKIIPRSFMKKTIPELQFQEANELLQRNNMGIDFVNNYNHQISHPPPQLNDDLQSHTHRQSSSNNNEEQQAQQLDMDPDSSAEEEEESVIAPPVAQNIVEEQVDIFNSNLRVSNKDDEIMDLEQEMGKAPRHTPERERLIEIDNEEDKEEEKELIVRNGSLLVVDRIVRDNQREQSKSLVIPDDLKSNQFDLGMNQGINNDSKSDKNSISQSEDMHFKSSPNVKLDNHRKAEVSVEEQAVTKMDCNEHDPIDLDRELPQCRFCWDNETSNENPLLSSCKCRGGVQYIHFSCLRNWIKAQRQEKISGGVTQFYWKTFECEICKTPYPFVFKAQGHKYNITEIPRPEGDYIVLESLTLEKNISRMIFVISIDPIRAAPQTVFNIGRGHDSHLRVNDISVSRCHSKIKFWNGKFFLEDNMSKFGTLVLVRDQLALPPKMEQAVQIGRSLINFAVHKARQKEYKCGEYLKKDGQVLNPNFADQEKQIKQLYNNLKCAEDYIKKQQAEHQKLKVSDNFNNRDNYQRRVQQNVLEEELKIERSQESNESDLEEEKVDMRIRASEDMHHFVSNREIQGARDGGLVFHDRLQRPMVEFLQNMPPNASQNQEPQLHGGLRFNNLFSNGSGQSQGDQNPQNN